MLHQLPGTGVSAEPPRLPPPPHPLAQFLGEQHDRHGGHLTWPGDDVTKLPVRGEVEEKLVYPLERPKAFCLVTDQRQELFDLQDPEQKEYHSWVLRRVRSGWFLEDRRELRWSDDGREVRVYMEWTQRYVEATHANAKDRQDDREGRESVTYR